MQIVRYRHYREYVEQRIQANDTMMGLLAGANLASQTLFLTQGSNLELSKIFPAVPHIKRFNLTTDKARAVLENAENLLGILAVPRVLALHEDLIIGMLRLLGKSNTSLKNVGMADMHELFQTTIGSNFTDDSLRLFHLVRLARNTHIHQAGRATSKLEDVISGTPQSTHEAWEKITGVAFTRYRKDEYVTLGVPELIGILALTKRLAEEANVHLQATIKREKWAELVVSDWQLDRRPGNIKQQFRQVTGLARREYGPISLTSNELETAMSKAGFAVT
ncbi:hypothetical protein [Arthrobacter sp. FW306-07-I]|uniref:hypothetical protein n=1 Tax=Arthrobacter sp. FW306-07-I TaxID=2879622 RepID=UPI001F265782|nr:hypothetical protein [Arthrobacter sp. FW306-07-I]UKA76465.1 hypothetical protein LFT46_05255 [Arthrobacter sp. FW306-07-I]